MRHLRVALYDLTSGTAEEAIEICRNGVLAIFEQQPGFVRYELGSLDDGGLVSFSIWETAEDAERANDVSASFNRANLADRVALRELHTGNIAWDEGA